MDQLLTEGTINIQAGTTVQAVVDQVLADAKARGFIDQDLIPLFVVMDEGKVEIVMSDFTALVIELGPTGPVN